MNCQSPELAAQAMTSMADQPDSLLFAAYRLDDGSYTVNSLRVPKEKRTQSKKRRKRSRDLRSSKKSESSKGSESSLASRGKSVTDMSSTDIDNMQDADVMRYWLKEFFANRQV